MRTIIDDTRRIPISKKKYKPSKSMIFNPSNIGTFGENKPIHKKLAEEIGTLKAKNDILTKRIEGLEVIIATVGSLAHEHIEDEEL